MLKLLARYALFIVLPIAAVAAQQPAVEQGAQPAPAPPASVDQKAEAYSNYILGHIDQVQFEDTGDQNYVGQAIDYYKKAEALDPSSIEIPLQMAATYAESDQLRAAVSTAQSILDNHPDNLEAHRLLARIYVRTLGQTSPDSQQEQTLALAVQQYQEILRLDPADGEAGLWLARLYRFQNQPDKAQQVLEQMLSRNPDNRQAIEQYAQLLLDEGHPHQAIARLSKSAADSGDSGLYFLLGDAYTQTHDTANAEQAYRKAAQLDPDDPDVVRRLAGTLFDESKYDEAVPEYQQLVNLDPSDPNSYLRLAEIFYKQKKYDLAETNITQAQQRAPGNLEVVYNQALIDEALGHFSDAVDVLSSAIASLKQKPSSQAISPRVSSVLYEELGRIYRQQGNYGAAIDTFQQLMALGPSDVQRGRLELIETYQENNQIDDAITQAQQAIEAEPQDRQMKVTYAFLLGEKNQTSDAVKTLRSLLNGTPDDRETYLEIAQVNLRGRRYADAVQAANTAASMAKQPNQQNAAWLLLGEIAEQQKLYGPAEQQFQKVLAANPGNDTLADTLNDYGYMLAEQGVRLDQASDMVKRALAIEPTNSAYLDSLGWVYYKQNRLADARDSLLKAISLSPNDPTILGHLGDVYQGLGQDDLAISTWEKALTQWHRAVPADYEPDQVREIEKKISKAKHQTGRTNHSAAEISR